MVVHGRRGQHAVVMLDDLLDLPVFELVAPGVAETHAAYAAFVTFGKGSSHPAGLNFGDVFSYALAKVRALPLLLKAVISPIRILCEQVRHRLERVDEPISTTPCCRHG